MSVNDNPDPRDAQIARLKEALRRLSGSVTEYERHRILTDPTHYFHAALKGDEK